MERARAPSRLLDALGRKMNNINLRIDGEESASILKQAMPSFLSSEA
jgi:hypothetical protein